MSQSVQVECSCCAQVSRYELDFCLILGWKDDESFIRGHGIPETPSPQAFQHLAAGFAQMLGQMGIKPPPRYTAGGPS